MSDVLQFTRTSKKLRWYFLREMLKFPLELFLNSRIFVIFKIISQRQGRSRILLASMGKLSYRICGKRWRVVDTTGYLLFIIMIIFAHEPIDSWKIPRVFYTPCYNPWWDGVQCHNQSKIVVVQPLTWATDIAFP